MKVKNTNLQVSDIVTAYITFVNGKGGKRRPALIVADTNDKFAMVSITSKYENKSDQIKKQYYPLEDWVKEGLTKKSYIDILSLKWVKRDLQSRFKKIGIITINDEQKLSEFVIKYRKEFKGRIDK
ncbi:toxin-antitoxin system, toxin component, MazF family protein [Lactobacillus sp. ESL0684]|uniref:toxin-antitoxin system, toxin component, MazF family protein n=1 Tax=Lactobacillus sp. ESL0684 TaxID=2983213 RepID=UPI0023FA36AA|nr:toxin-antitoxin system, toxin component, MazF family protein [Lactobacillus sp. ESL0684]WEV44199.1 toxin-antitoxin system, toxin component, MazF family protein [Lactobacillus sp. ESL0684]